MSIDSQPSSTMPPRTLGLLAALGTLATTLAAGEAAPQDRVVYAGGAGPGAGKHVVLLAGDEEYRSEEALPMLGRILAVRHGFRCTVLFSLGADGSIAPDNRTSLAGSEALESADAIVMLLRFRAWPDADMKRFVAAYQRGVPIVALRTSTHAFSFDKGPSAYAAYSWNAKGEWQGGFGRQVLGETWIAHHGAHKKEATRGVIEDSAKDHPVLRGVGDVFGDTDVYTAAPPADATVLMRGQVLSGMKPTDPPVEGKKNAPMQPVAWTRERRNEAGAVNKVLCTTMASATDLANEGLRRLVVNGVFWGLGLEVPAKADVATVGAFRPTMYGFNTFRKGMRPADLALADPPGAIPPDAPSGAAPAQPSAAPGAQAPAAAPPPAEGGARASALPLPLQRGERIALVGNALGERFNLFGHFEALLHGRHRDLELVVRNFCWPADEVGVRQRPSDYTKIDDPLAVFGAQTFLCFFGFNESFAGEQGIARFKADYARFLAEHGKRYARDGRAPRFVLVTPIAWEAGGDPLHPDPDAANARLKAYAAAVAEVAAAAGIAHVDLFTPTLALFAAKPGLQHTVNGCHLDEAGDREVALLLDRALAGADNPAKPGTAAFERLRAAVNDKSWVHQQDYRMLNGWYVYGGRNGLNKPTYPPEYAKIRAMAAVRDRFCWDIAQGKAVPAQPDDSGTGELPKIPAKGEAKYPTPEAAIAAMKTPPGLEVRCFASEREFPELAKPVQIGFDAKGRLWVACMPSYPHWRPGDPRPSDRLLILADADGDGKADRCTVFYDKLHCPTGFEFWNGGVLVVDQPRLLFLKDTDGDDKADLVVHLSDGWATDDSHHTISAFEWSNGGLLHMLEGISMSTTVETPWGPFRNRDTPGAYVLDPRTQRLRRFVTPGYGNPWTYVFDRWGQGFCGDGSSPQQHWDTPLSGAPIGNRKGLPIVFDKGVRPIGGAEFIASRHLPDELQGRFVYTCVINLLGIASFQPRDDGAGFKGSRLDDLLQSSDKTFRPMDPQIGPDGALWFADWTNVIIGHLQHPQRDPLRDRAHGRIYRLVAKDRPLLAPALQAGAPIPALLDQLREPETRTRYRARRELRDRPTAEVLAAIAAWTARIAETDPLRDQLLCEALWVQAGHRAVDAALLKQALRAKTPEARAAATRVLADEWDRVADAMKLIAPQAKDAHPRVRAEALRALSFVQTREAVELALEAAQRPADVWLSYLIDATMAALQPVWQPYVKKQEPIAPKNERASAFLRDWVAAQGKDGAWIRQYRALVAGDTPKDQRGKALEAVLAAAGDAGRGKAVFARICTACHKAGEDGADFGPELSAIAARMDRRALMESILEPGAKVDPAWASTVVETADGQALTGFVIAEDAQTITLRVAAGQDERVRKADVRKRETVAESSMPEGLPAGMAAQEFVDLVTYLEGLK